MTGDQIARNLTIFLDPAGGATEDSPRLRFRDWDGSRRRGFSLAVEGEKESHTVYCFSRRHLLGYFLFSLYFSLRRLPVKRVLYLNDGLLSSFFDAYNTRAYRFFAARFLPSPNILRRSIISLLPPVLRAEKRYVLVNGGCEMNEISGVDEAVKMLGGQDLMFFSNPRGKLLLTSTETLRYGRGALIKTAACPSYLEVMEKEYSTMLRISSTAEKGRCLPRVGERIRIRSRVYYTEEYIEGCSLLEVLRRLSRNGDLDGMCRILDRLDLWFEEYVSLFDGTTHPLAPCYRRVLEVFSTLYGTDGEAATVMRSAETTLAELECCRVEVATVTAHNDLWPGNFVVGADRLIAVDWERSAENRPPIFDYYWMMVSAVLVYIGCRARTERFAETFPLFCKADDGVSRYALAKLASFLARRGLGKVLHRKFMQLFLIELSVQGYLALGTPSDLDRMAFGELAGYSVLSAE